MNQLARGLLPGRKRHQRVASVMVVRISMDRKCRYLDNIFVEGL